MSDRNMAVTSPCVQNACGEHSGNMSVIPVEFSEIAALCMATEDTIGGVMQLCIADHRTLHTGLGVGRDHTNWIKGRNKDCGLVENRDYEVFAETGENPLGGRPGKVYRLSLHAAKEIAMMEGNDKGKLVRRYFIWVEENAQRMSAQQPAALDLSNPDHLLPLLAQYASDKKQLLARVHEMQPAVKALDRLAKPTDGAMCITDAAKDLQVRPNDLIRFLEENHWIYRRAGGKRRMVAYQNRIQSGHLKHKLKEVDDGEGGTKIAEQVLVTARGRVLLAKLLSQGDE